MVKRLSLVLGLVFFGKLLVTSGCASRPAVPSTTTAAWNEARGRAERLLAAKYGGSHDVRGGVPGFRFLFHADVPDFARNRGMVLIHRGEIFEDKGLKALGRYLREVKFLDGSPPPVDSFVHLWLHVKLPRLASSTAETAPHHGYAGSESENPRLLPKLTWSRDEAVFSLFYRLPSSGHPGDRDERFGPAPPLDVVEWQIVIPRSYKLFMRKKRHLYRLERHRFVHP